MENALILARVLGPMLVIVSVGLLLNPKAYREVAEEFIQSRALLYLGGFMALAGGLVVLQLFHAWRADWTVVVTIIGWLMLIKGAALIIIPGPLAALAEAWRKAGAIMVVQGLVLLAVGVWLCYRGFFG
ncbi:MAG: hypothetical protein KJ720_07080 [Proteobacteria bacterium]|nr:hypothetical protein [Pseudomonadota bacterium]MBU1452054.1 hypothetical protein [Pseudomonadota bacterium]MBU2468037.1 hypothetical protein [Pseudomonadota bacterium]MBU2519164.1 hypothetical protein [Pseudomonadota bacterium]